MRHLASFSYALAAALLFSGCGWQAGSAESDAPAASGGVAIIDLDEVAKQLGRTDEMNEAIKEKQAALNSQLANIQTSFVEQFDARAQQYGDQPTPEQAQELQSIRQKIRLQLSQAQQQATNNFKWHRSSLINKFRDDVRPIAQQIAAERGLSIVVPKNEGLILALDPAVDITGAVIEAMAASGGAVTSATSALGAVHPSEPAPITPHNPSPITRVPPPSEIPPQPIQPATYGNSP